MFSYALVSPSEKVTFRNEILVWLAKELDILFPGKTKGMLNIAFLDDSEIRCLNRDYRNIDKTTDVLSFHYFDDFSGISEEEVAGEIILSESRILEQADEYQETVEAEFCKLLVHSSLHILGYDHETKEQYHAMYPLEKALGDKLMSEFGVEVK